MTKVISPLFSEAARGKCGSLVYSVRRGTAYVRTNPAQTHPNTQKQLNQRARILQVTRRWNDLTNEQRKSWTDYAASHPDIDWTGNPKRLTGQSWYIRCNARLLRLGKSVNDNAPTTPAPAAPKAAEISAAGLTTTINWTNSKQPTDRDYIATIWRSGPTSTGRSQRRERARIIADVLAAAQTYSDTVDTAGTYRYWIEIIDPIDGTYSPEISKQITLAPAPAVEYGRITGRLKHYDGSPITNWKVYADSIIAYSDSAGIYTFEDLIPGWYFVQPEPREDGDWDPFAQSAEVIAGETTALPDFILLPL